MIFYAENLFEWDILKPLVIPTGYEPAFLTNVRRLHLLLNGKEAEDASDDTIAQSLKDLHAHGCCLQYLNIDFSGPFSLLRPDSAFGKALIAVHNEGQITMGAFGGKVLNGVRDFEDLKGALAPGMDWKTVNMVIVPDKFEVCMWHLAAYEPFYEKDSIVSKGQWMSYSRKCDADFGVLFKPTCYDEGVHIC